MKTFLISNRLIRSAVTFGAIAVIAVLSYLGLISKALDKTVMSGVHIATNTYLEQDRARAIVVFAGLSSYKAVISVIEGSGVGIKIGNAARPLNDFVDIAWKIVLASIVALIIQQLLIGSFSSMAFSFLLAGGMLFLLLSLAIKQFKKESLAPLFRKLAHVLILFALIVYILAPLLIWSGNALADRITVSQNEKSIAMIKADIEEIKSLDVFTWHVDKLAKDMRTRVKGLLLHSSTALFWLIACYLISGAILPVLILVTIYLIMKFTWIQIMSR